MSDVASALRTVADRLESEFENGKRSNQIGLNDLSDAMHAVADIIQPPTARLALLQERVEKLKQAARILYAIGTPDCVAAGDAVDAVLERMVKR